MNKYINLNEVLLLANADFECHFKPLPRKKIMFQGTKATGETITLCSPQSKMYPQGFYWVDITQEQARILNDTDKGVVFFRLEGRNLVKVQWSDLQQYLTNDCIKYNPNEQNHWKLHIYKDRIKVSGNPNEMPTNLYPYAPNRVEGYPLVE